MTDLATQLAISRARQSYGDFKDAVVDVIFEYHNDESHPGPFRTCDKRPCAEMRRVTRDERGGL